MLTTFILALGCLLWNFQGAARAAEPPRLWLLRGETLAAQREAVRQDDARLRPALHKLRGEADAALRLAPPSVVQKTRVPPSGDKHDYLSWGPYWWPDPARADGLPYIRRDGEVNPQSRDGSTDRTALQTMSQACETLSLAYFFTSDQRYARQSALLLRTWFLAPATRMNPHLQYGQAIPGITEGRDIGIIDTVALLRVVDSGELLAGSPALTDDDRRGLRAWFAAYLKWLLESKHGRSEATQRNNHGTWYDAQVASFALLVDQPEVARRTLATVAARRLATQLAADGGQPHELARTRSFDYSVMNLRGLLTLARLGEHVQVDLWSWRGAEGQTLLSAAEYLAPYAHQDNKWTHRQIVELKREGLTTALLAVPEARRSPSLRRALDQLAADFPAHEAWLLYRHPATPAP